MEQEAGVFPRAFLALQANVFLDPPAIIILEKN
jgi:hypothetical protein